MTLDRNKLKEHCDSQHDGAILIHVSDVRALLAELEAAEQARDLALANADFWERELNNFRRNAAHRAEQLAKEKVEAAEERVRELTQHNDFLQRREKHFAEALAVADGGKFRNDWDARIQSVIDENKRLSVMETALRNLVEKLKLILPKVDAMCVMESVHGRPYRGPTIVDELAAAMKALSDQGGNNGA